MNLKYCAILSIFGCRSHTICLTLTFITSLSNNSQTEMLMLTLMQWHLLYPARYKMSWKLQTHHRNSYYPQCTSLAGRKQMGWLGLLDSRGPMVALVVVFDELCTYETRTSGLTMWHLRLSKAPGSKPSHWYAHTTSTASCAPQMWAKSNEWCMLFTMGLWEAEWDKGAVGGASHPPLWLWLKIFPKQLMNMQQSGNKPWLKATDLSIVYIPTRLSNTSRVL